MQHRCIVLGDVHGDYARHGCFKYILPGPCTRAGRSANAHSLEHAPSLPDSLKDVYAISVSHAVNRRNCEPFS